MTEIQLSPSEQLLYTTVRIEARNGGKTSTGTGFLFRFLDDGDLHVPAIVTNRHVVKGSATGSFQVNVADASGAPSLGDHITVNLDKFGQRWIGHPDPDVDLCIMPIAPVIEGAKAQGKTLFYRMLHKDLLLDAAGLAELMAIEDVVMVGYPSGIWDDANNRPIVRRGITATAPSVEYRGRAEFMIDAACFPGSSGSPVYLFNQGFVPTRTATKVGNRVALLGILYAGPQFTAEGEIEVRDIPTVARPVAVSRIPINLGICIKARRLMDFEPILEDIVAKERLPAGSTSDSSAA